MFKSILFALLIVALLLPAAAPVQAAPDAQTCVYTTHNVGSVYDPETQTYRVETLGEVARAHNISSSRIRSLNPNTVLSPLMVGQRLNVWHCSAPLPDPTPRPRATPRPVSGYRCMITSTGHLVCPARTQ